MLQKLKKSKASSNFWTNISTIVSALIYAALLTFVNNPELIKETSIVAVLGIVLQNTSNVITHMNKE